MKSIICTSYNPHTPRQPSGGPSARRLLVHLTPIKQGHTEFSKSKHEGGAVLRRVLQSASSLAYYIVITQQKQETFTLHARHRENEIVKFQVGSATISCWSRQSRKILWSHTAMVTYRGDMCRTSRCRSNNVKRRTLSLWFITVEV